MAKDKLCPKCGNIKPLEDFPKKASRTDGHDSYCKQCKSAYDKERRKQKGNILNEQCRRWHEENKEYIRSYYKKYKKEVGERKRKELRGQSCKIYIKQCLTCDKTFISRYSTKKYCCKSCSTRYYDLADTRYRICAYCKKEYDFFHKGSQSYCSDECKHKASKAQNRLYRKRNGKRTHKQRADKYGCVYEVVDRIAVFERDNWTCQLTGIKTPRSLMGSNLPNEPTIDHIIPLSKGGSHTYDNLQCVSRYANSIKSDKLIGQLRIDLTIAS